MTTRNSETPENLGDDQTPYEFRYDHGRMPLFMKIIWVGFLVGATLYIVNHLLTALADEVGG